jgi:hypothetical protein
MCDRPFHFDPESLPQPLLKRIGTLEGEIASLQGGNGRLRTGNERLKRELAAARKDSRNSSWQPSSDIVRPSPSGGGGKRRIGGQPGREAHFRTPALVEPTNNRAEQAVRQVVIDRAATQGTRSPKGRACRERMRTVLSACAKRRLTAFSFILNPLFAHSSHAHSPSLLN